jgi:putative ABC transport system permease protein
VGARPRDIQAQFLLETAATVFAGGVVGVLLAWVGAELVARRMALGDVSMWKAALLGLVLSAATGLAAGVLPARRAARLTPAEALRC